MANKKYIYVCKECLEVRCNRNFTSEQKNIKCPKGKTTAWTLIAVVFNKTKPSTYYTK